MTTVLGFLSEKIPRREKISALFVTEIRIYLFAFSLITICMEVFLLLKGDSYEVSRGSYALAFTLFYFFYCALYYLFALFVSRVPSSFLSLIPPLLVFLLLRKADAPPYWGAAAITAAAAGLFFAFIPRREELVLYGSFVLDAVALYLCFDRRVLLGSHFTDKILFVFLVVLTLAALQRLLCERIGTAYPFLFFVLLGALLLFIPMNKDPIDWTPVVEAGQQMVRKVMDVAYYLTSSSDQDAYKTGYSSMDGTGETLTESERVQIILRMNDKPYYVYWDAETSEKMMVRRTIHLVGGESVDKQQLVRFLALLHAGGVDSETSALFSRVSEVTVEYAYLATADEIAPAGSIMLSADGQKIESPTGSARHKKGYQIDARYLEIDYGNPELIGLLRSAGESGAEDLTYEEACAYAEELYGIDLAGIVDRQEYGDSGSVDVLIPYTDTSEAGSRMRDLAAELTGDCLNDYDKCKSVEGYLRQLTYSTNAVGGYDPDSDMGTPEGMSDIADRFLFETQRGYCVHFTSSMVMLLRLAGIPARAVAGYRYVFPFEQAEAYEVGGDCAHIWPEAWLEGVGWVPFEPTAAYRTAVDYTWHRGATPAAAKEQDDHAAALPPAPAAAEKETEPPADATAPFFTVVLPLLLSIVILLAALVAGTSIARRLRYKHGTPEEKLKTDVEMIKKAIRRSSSDKFVDRGLLSDYIPCVPEELRPDLRRVFDAYYRVVYGDGCSAVSAEENELARSVRENVTGGQSRCHIARN